MFLPGKAYPQHYPQQIDEKLSAFKQLLARFDLPETAIYPSPPSHYRMRAEFRIWHQGERAKYVMYQGSSEKKRLEISDFSIGTPVIANCMAPLMAEINSSSLLRQRLFQVEFLAATTGDLVISLIYHKRLDEAWRSHAETLSRQFNTSIIGRSKKQKLVIGKDYVLEEFTVAGTTYQYQHVETSFSQPNAAVCADMLNWADDVCQQTTPQRDLLELYCGNGNFTLPLSIRFRKTVATEISKTSLASAKFNMALNGIAHIALARMSSEEFTQALNQERPFRRLAHINLKDYDFSTILVDPPRSGLDAATELLCRRFDNILYISCNPQSLATNLDTLTKTHCIRQLALFDQFPYTPHLECGLWLQKP